MRGLPAIASLALGGSLIACSDAPPEPSVLPPLISPAVEATVDPSAPGIAAPPAPPLPAASPTLDGATDFARQWYDAIVAAFASRDAQQLEALSDPACHLCQSYIGSVQSLREYDERVEGPAITVTSAEAALAPDGLIEVTAVYDRSGARRYTADGTLVVDEPAHDGVREVLLLTRDGAGWRLLQITA